MEPAVYRAMAQFQEEHWWFAGGRMLVTVLPFGASVGAVLRAA